ncbi:hypothetical protein [Streptomyces sp. NPDC005322]|uniref:hypothetical protein n=1 Tax=unclassified Streptomyces TaxID=2593676 RepID=UPI0033B2023A
MSHPTPQPPNDHQPQRRPPSGPALFSVRTAVVLLISALAGLGAGVLRLRTGPSWPEAVEAAAVTFGGTLVVVDQLIKKE